MTGGATAVRHMQKVLEHVETIVAIELLVAAQGIDLRRQVMHVERVVGRRHRIGLPANPSKGTLFTG